MWAVQNRTQFVTERTWVRDSKGAEVWIVVVKATFDILNDGTTRLSQSQEPVRTGPLYRGKPGASSLLYDADLVYDKPLVDVLVNGSAYSPRGVPAAEVDVSVSFGSWNKSLRVFGDRRWEYTGLGLVPSKPESFVSMPIVYERASGGREATSISAGTRQEDRNPVGIGFATAASQLAGCPVANIEQPDDPIRFWNQLPNPAGFGPIARHWQPRISLAGTYDDNWQRTRQPLLPLDFDSRFYQSAPTDQQLSQPHQDDILELRNMTSSGLLRFKLPYLRLGMSTMIGDRFVHHRPKLHTVIIEPEFPRVILVLHSALPCHKDVNRLRFTRVFEKQNSSGPSSSAFA